MDEVEAVGFAMWKAEADRAAPNVGKNRAIENYRYDLDPTSRAKWDQIAQAAIAALDAARGDQVARVVEWLRNGGGTDISQLNGSMQMLFLKGMNRYADAIERGEPFRD